MDAVAAALAAAKMRSEKAKALTSASAPKTPPPKPGASRSFSRGSTSGSWTVDSTEDSQVLVRKDGKQGYVKGTPPNKVKKNKGSSPETSSGSKANSTTATSGDRSSASQAAHPTKVPKLTRRRLFRPTDQEQEVDNTAKDKGQPSEDADQPSRKAPKVSVPSAAKSKAAPSKPKKATPAPCPQTRPGVKKSGSTQDAGDQPDDGDGAAAPSGSEPAPEGTKAVKTKDDQGGSLSDALNRAGTAEQLVDKDADARAAKKKKKYENRDKETHNRKMRFYRSLDSANSPEEVHDLAAAARTGERKSQKMQVLFEQWLSANEDWSESTLVMSMRHSHTHTKRGSRRWMTRAELMEKYKDESVVDEIFGEKERDSGTKIHCCRAHPDAPNNPKLKQFLCYDEETEADSEDVVLSSLFECKDSGKSKKDKKRKRSTSSSSSSSSSSASQESSDSDSGEKKSKKKKKSKKSKKGKKGKSSKNKGKKDKKKSKAEKEKDKERRDKKELKEKERAAEKENQDHRSKAKKVLNALQSSISDAAKREAKAKKMSPGIQEVVLKELGSLKSKMAEKRDALQSIIDGDKVDRMKGAAEAGDAALKHYNANKPAA